MDRRILPRHVDSRYKIFFVPLSKAVFILPLELLIFTLFFKLGTTYNFELVFISFIIIIPLHLFFMELKNKESGFDIIKDYILLQLKGEIPFERSSKNVPKNKRYINNRIKRQSTDESC